METALDEIAKGEKNKLEELEEFYNGFVPLFDNAKENMDGKYPIITEEVCPQCGSHLVIRLGKYGEFTACSNYPSCKYIKKEEEVEDNDTGVVCPECGKKHLVKRTAKTGKNKGAVFYACDNYPKCKTVFNDLPTNEVCPNCGSIMLKNADGELYCSKECESDKPIEIVCPSCNKGHIVRKLASRGKNKGNYFYACSNYPKCKTILEGEPTNEVCPNCGSIMLKDNDGNLFCMKHCEATNAHAEEIKPASEVKITCNKCNKGHFVLRQASRGKNSGKEFYACNNYPKCKNIISIEEYNNMKK